MIILYPINNIISYQFSVQQFTLFLNVHTESSSDISARNYMPPARRVLTDVFTVRFANLLASNFHHVFVIDI